jgi:hypothetical protein
MILIEMSHLKTYFKGMGFENTLERLFIIEKIIPINLV